MLKIEYIWRELLYRSIERRHTLFNINELGKMFSMSTSLVNHAIIPLKELGIVKIAKKNSQVVDIERLLYFWATRRNLKKDIIYSANSSESVFEREALMPPLVTPTAYSAVHLNLNQIPSDYDLLYYYADDISLIRKRFPENDNKRRNIIILKQDPFLGKYKRIPLAQIFADLWNLPEWYAKDFSNIVLSIIKKKIGL